MAKVESRFAAFDAARSEHKTSCLLCTWLEDAPREDAAYIGALLTAPLKVKGHEHIAKVLADGGVKISADVVRKHRTRHLSQ